MNLKIAAAGSAAALLFLAGCSSSDSDEASETPAASMEATDAMESDSMESVGTIVDVAAANEDFETLVAAVTAADLVETLAGEGPYTVFAPTDDAFDALPEGLLTALLEPENKDTLTAILRYHVVSGEVTSDQVSAGEVPTVQGESITVSVTSDDKVLLNDSAEVIAKDVDADNGVIHVIDAVIVPPSIDPSTLL